jgi:hypothetical protein
MPVSAFVTVAASAAASAFITAAGAELTCDYFVSSSNGSDQNAGTSVYAPFRTLQHAIQAPLPSPSAAGRTVCLRSETHELDNTVVVDYSIAAPGRALTITGYPGDLASGLPRPVLSGGTVVGPFTAPPGGGAGPWSAIAPAGVARPSLLFREDGSFLQRARIPDMVPADARARHMGSNSTLQFTAVLPPPLDNCSGFLVDASDFPPGFTLTASDQAQVLVFGAWVGFWKDVSVLNTTNSTLMFDKCVRVERTCASPPTHVIAGF